MNIEKSYKFTLLAVDALNDGEGWTWDSWYTLEEDIFFLGFPDDKRVLEFLRRAGYLKKGVGLNRCYIDDDGYNLVITERKSHMPILALCYGEHWEFNAL